MCKMYWLIKKLSCPRRKVYIDNIIHIAHLKINKIIGNIRKCLDNVQCFSWDFISPSSRNIN